MSTRTWFITGVSSGFGRELAKHLLGRGDRVVGTIRKAGDAADLLERHPKTFRAPVLDVTDTPALRRVVEDAFAALGRIAVVVISGLRPLRRGGGPSAPLADDVNDAVSSSTWISTSRSD